jgi:hypothetical protein
LRILYVADALEACGDPADLRVVVDCLEELAMTLAWHGL